ncbi:NnrU family protein [bacterium]|jgi:protein-S-isoprenylcysteine O-methyltransferase Ste14|nr:NnrU family protein [bacterium]
MSKVIMVLYGGVAYFIGVVGLVSIIVVLAGLMPWGFLSLANMDMSSAIAWNIALVAVWGIIHSVMARPSFKQKLTQFIPEPAERPTYVLIAGITSVALVGYWQPIEGIVWSIQNDALAMTLWGIFVFGWAFLLLATFAINHFDLFGLRQVYYYAKGENRPPLAFVKRMMYAHIRHPIQTGVLIGVWATPTMSNTQVILSVGFTAYIFVGLWFEERDLIAAHGEEYLSYKAETGMVLPRIK